MTIANVLLGGRISLKPNPSGSFILIILTLLMRIVWSFVWSEFSSVGGRRMMRWDEGWTKAQSWGCPCQPKKYPRSTSVKAWEFPRHSLLHQQKYQVIFQDTILLLLHIICVILGALVIFCFQFCFVLFAVVYGWILSYLSREIHAPFSLPRTL